MRRLRNAWILATLVVVAFAELGRVLVAPRRKPRDTDSLSEHLKRDVGLRS